MDEEQFCMKINDCRVRVLERHTDNPDYDTEKRQVFIVGSKGIPAAYGGFETFVEKLTAYQVSAKIRYHVSRIASDTVRYEYNGAKCFSVKVPNIGAAKAVCYDIAALKWCIDYCKARPRIKSPVFYVLACRIGPFIGRFKKEIERLGGALYVNPDGHEWLRAKWSAPVKKYWKISEAGMVKHSDLLICDSRNIEKYIQETYRKYHPKTKFIAYGSDTRPSVLKDSDEKYTKWLRDRGLSPKGYYLVVGRFVPENSFEMMIREFMRTGSKKDLVIITTVNETFLRKLEKELGFRQDKRIKFAGAVYDEELLKKIRENAYAYLHGHTVGGTNPSLLEALGSTELNLLVDVAFNREVALDAALYWNREAGALSGLIEKADGMSGEAITAMGKKAKQRVNEAYSWDSIIDEYEKLFLSGR